MDEIEKITRFAPATPQKKDQDTLRRHCDRSVRHQGVDGLPR